MIIIFLVISGSTSFMLLSFTLQSTDADSTWTQTSNRDFDNGTLMNLSIEGGGSDAFLQINLSGLHNWIGRSPTNSPPPSYYLEIDPIYGDDKFLLYGRALNYTLQIMETWVFDFSDDAWTDRTPSTTPSSYPPALYSQPLASIYGDDKVITFGGGALYSGNVYNDTWEYDLSEDLWTDKTQSYRPHARQYHEMSYFYGDDKVLLFGGTYPIFVMPMVVYCKGTWVYDSSLGTWTDNTPSPLPTNYPEGRINHGMAPIYGTKKVLVFGGSNNLLSQTILGDTWVYDLDTNSWTDMAPNGPKPCARANHAMAPIHGDDKVLLFGGRQTFGSNYLDDTWVYDLSENTWTEMIPRSASNKPSQRYDAELAALYGRDKIIMHGGKTTGTTYLNDTWEYTHFLPTRNGTFVSASYDTGTTSNFMNITINTDVPDYANIRLQLRSAANESLLTTQAFVGPDGTASTYYNSSSTEIWSGHNNDRWIQFKVFFNIDFVQDSPRLQDVTINYNCLPKTINLGPLNGSMINTNKPSFTWTFDDLDSQVQNAYQVLIDDDINFNNAIFDSGERSIQEQSWDFSEGINNTIIPDGIWYWTVRTKDENGAWSEFSDPWTLIIDTNAPSSAISYPINDDIYYRVNSISGTANDTNVRGGIDKVEIAIRKLNNNYYWNGFNWDSYPCWLLTNGTTDWVYNSSNVIWQSGILYEIQPRATDNATNIEISEKAIKFSIDRDHPISWIDFPIDNTWLNKLNNITGSSNDLSGSGVAAVEISFVCTNDYFPWIGEARKNHYWDGNKWSEGECWLPTSGTTQWSYDSSKINWSTGDQYLICSRAIDHLDNIGISNIGNSFRFDNTPPQSLSININNGEEFTTNVDITLSLEAEDLGIGIAQMAFSINGIDWSPWEPYNNLKIFNLPSSDGNKTVSYTVRDQLGNVAENVSDSIILDRIPPEDVSININDDAEFSNSKFVSLTINASDSTSGVSDMSFSSDEKSWTPWESFRRKRSFTLPNGDGEKTIYIQVRDKVGNIAQIVSDSIILDTKPPHSLSILINDGNPETNLTLVPLKLDAIDDTSGIYQFSLSLNGVDWSTWENFTETRVKYFKLPDGNGLKTIYFNVKDRVGNIAKPINASIYMKILEPTSEKSKEEKDITNTGIQLLYIILLIIILIILILGFINFIVKTKRTHREELQLLAPSMVTKPVALPETTMISDQILPPASPEQLPSAVQATSTPQSNVDTTPIPTLAKSTITSTTTGIPTVKSQSQELPQLPPAPTQTPHEQIPITTPEPSEQTSVVVIPTPQVVQPTVAQEQKPASEKKEEGQT
jgi:hypothetical protein